MANKKSSKAKETPCSHCSSLVGEMIEINRKGLLLLVFAVIGTLEKALAVTQITDSNFHSAIETCLGTNPVDGLCSSSEYGSMPDWDVSLVTDMSGWNGTAYQGFGGKSTFNGDISEWNTAKVTTMAGMFRCGLYVQFSSAFNQDIGRWNTEKVTNMKSMFRFATAFNQDIGGWNTAQVTNMGFMFYYAFAFSHDIGRWNTSKVADMRAMFYYASAFNQDISLWTGLAATTAQSDMFLYASAFQAKYTCGTDGPASSCDTIESTLADQPPPSSSDITLNGFLGLISASLVAFVLV